MREMFLWPCNGSKMKKKRTNFIAAMLIVILALFTACGGSKASAEYKHLEPDEAEAMISAGECTLVDCRSDVKFGRSHIPGSINVPVTSEDSAIEEMLPDKDALILVYCDYGGESKQFADHLTFDLGYSNINEFDGLAVWAGDLESE